LLGRDGDFLKIGSVITDIYHNEGIKVTVEVPAFIASKLILGDNVQVIGDVGYVNSGAEITMISRAANPITRNYLVEALMENEAGLLSGMSVEMEFDVSDKRYGLKIPSSMLTLGDEGKVGVKYLDDKDIVKFLEVDISDYKDSSVWIFNHTNAYMDVIGLGAGYAKIGSAVSVERVLK